MCVVPQDIRLLDASVRENIAFGRSADQIDDDQIWAALASAQFDDVEVKCLMVSIL